VGNPFVWIDANGRPRVYVQGTASNLLEFIPDGLNGRLWNVYDQSANTGGVGIAGDAFAATDGSGRPHVYVQGTASNLLEFIPDGLNGRVWNAYDQTANTGGAGVAGDPFAWMDVNGRPHVYVRGTVSNLLEFIPDGLNGRLWNAYDQTANTGGAGVVGDPFAWTDGSGSAHVYGRGTASNLVEFVPDGRNGRLWNAYDDSAGTGAGVGGDPFVGTGT
jgi:hypothetical protein